jgi:multidrug resistance efflux pump
MTIDVDALEAELTTLHAQHKAIKARKREIGARLEAARAAAAAAATVAAMSPAERAAVAQMLGAAGIASAEGVGTPGA